MPLETATYISQLVSANPPGTDPETQGANHLRLLKATIQATFPNFTAAALNSTQAAIDAAATAVGNGTFALAAGSAAAPSLSLKADATTGLYGVAGELDITTAGVQRGKWNASGVTVTSGGVTVSAGNVAVTGNISASGTLSAGGTTLGATTVTTLGASGLATFSAGLTVSVGTTTLGTLNAGTTGLGATTASSLTVSGAATLQSTLNVSGTSTLAGLGAGATTLSSLTVTGGATLQSTLNVTGAAALSSTLSVTGAITPTGGIVGKTDGSNATAGNLGEYVEANAASTGFALTSAVATNIVSITLQAGDWDVWGSGCFDGTGTLSNLIVLALFTSITTSSASMDFTQGKCSGVSYETSGIPAFNGLGSTPVTCNIPPIRFNLTTPTTIYLVSEAVWTNNGGAGLGGFGCIKARRVR